MKNFRKGKLIVAAFALAGLVFAGYYFNFGNGQAKLDINQDCTIQKSAKYASTKCAVKKQPDLIKTSSKYDGGTLSLFDYSKFKITKVRSNWVKKSDGTYTNYKNLGTSKPVFKSSKAACVYSHTENANLLAIPVCEINISLPKVVEANALSNIKINFQTQICNNSGDKCETLHKNSYKDESEVSETIMNKELYKAVKALGLKDNDSAKLRVIIENTPYENKLLSTNLFDVLLVDVSPRYVFDTSNFGIKYVTPTDTVPSQFDLNKFPGQDVSCGYTNNVNGWFCNINFNFPEFIGSKYIEDFYNPANIPNLDVYFSLCSKSKCVEFDDWGFYPSVKQNNGATSPVMSSELSEAVEYLGLKSGDVASFMVTFRKTSLAPESGVYSVFENVHLVEVK
ncbi:MAG: hypothetical protein AAB373_04465 [Patescibacteria group bacterium]